VAEALADARDVPIGEAYDAVEATIEDGPLVEHDDGALGTVRIADPRAYAPDEDAPRPLAQYEHAGYAWDDDPERHLALDAAVRLTASRWGPPFDTGIDEADGEWWQEAYDCAVIAAETAIVDALVATEAELDVDHRDDEGGDTGEVDVSGETDIKTPEEPGKSGSTPTPDAAEGDANEHDADSDLKERSLEAFAAAIEFFHNQLDRDISDEFDGAPDTPREYYEERRGWDAETIADKRLGYAPADDMALLEHLMREGFDGDDIQGTGLFYEDLTPHFKGRYVLPYFDEDGRPVYAISRSLNHHEDGHRDDPKGDQKYTKAIKTKDRSHVDEPIYGAETLTDDTDRLLVAGGIADAITLHEAGYACISPVTTVRFKSKHEPRVVEFVEEYDLDGVYMLNDAERPSVDKTELGEGETADRIGDVLTIMQNGEGLRGAFGNAEFLLDEGVDPYLVELPGGDDDLRKLDPDDLVKEDWASVETLLTAARHANHHDAYQDWAANRRDREVRDAMQMGDRSGSHDGDTTDLFDLGFTDVAPLSLGDRQNNPLGHHGDSEGYFVCAEKNGFVHGYDHKYNVAYNALSYLLCDADERRADDPNGPLDEEEIFVAWRHAKEHGHLTEDDPVPFGALREVAVRDGVVERDALVERESDGDSGGSYLGFPDASAYNAALRHVEDTYGVDPGREPATPGSSDDEEHTTDPRDLFDEPVVVEPRDAWRAAGAVRPDDLDPDEGDHELPLDVTDDGEAWVTDDGHRVDGVVRAVAIAERLVAGPDEDLDADTFDEAYQRARRFYGAPVPEYVDETTATEQRWILQGALRQIDHTYLDRIRSPVTGLGEGDVVAEINPTWEYSASGARILAFRSGWFYCREHEVALDPLRFVALEEGILGDCHDDLEGEAFLDAVDALRERGAPVPRYEGDAADHEAVLPEADDLLEEFTTDADRLQQARDETEVLVEEAAADSDSADLVTVLPALGKTTSTVKNAANRPTLYAAPRKELQQEVVEKAADHGVSAYILPVLAENHITRDAKAEGAAAVRADGQDLLRRRDELVERIESDIHPDPDPEDVDEDEVDLDRASCDTANGAHGDDWQVAVQVASELGYSPRYIHQHANALFGDDIPCTCDDEHDDTTECAYSRAWDRVADPDRPVDLLVGARTHAYVKSARTWYGRDSDDRVDVEPRTVAIDEYPADAYGQQFGSEAPAIAAWLATALRDGLDAQRDVLEADLWDTWVRDWVHGKPEALPELRHIDTHLAACRGLLEARDAAADLQAEDRPDAVEAFRKAVDDGLGRDADANDVFALADAALASVRENSLPDTVARELGAALDDVLDAVSDVDGALGDPDLTADGHHLGETFRDLVDDAIGGALEHGEDHALEAARDACRGGEAGTAALAVAADDPYAHPKAYLLLAGMVADGEVVETSQFRFDPTRPRTQLTRTTVDGATILFDRDHDGAYVLDPPEFTDTSGSDCPVVGLDATGRETLWSLAIGEDVAQRDIHDSARERREFLRDVLNLQVVQTSPVVNSYSSPKNTNFDGDVSLVRSVAQEYGSGRDGRLRANTLSSTTDPGVITTKKARGRLEDRIDSHTAAIDHYGNVTGSNALADCNLGAVLGSRHFSDVPVEKWAALAGEEVTRTGRGADLSYDSDVAEEFLGHMREDQTMQAVLRFGRDEEGALVFVHTSCIAEDLPVVADGAVVSAHSKAGVEVRDAMLPYLRRGRTFTVSDLLEDVDASRRTVQRKVREFERLGYLDVEETADGLANNITPGEDPGVGDVDLPDLGASPGLDPDESPEVEYNTGIVGVRDGEYTARRGTSGQRAQLPAPTAEAEGDPPG
jgi:hypothetical protein